MPTIPWPPAHVADLVKLKADGMHHRKIAAALTEKYGYIYTREAVSGKVDRLRLANKRKTFWTDERVATLTAMHGRFSCGVIARELGTTRNSVISKATRMGLSLGVDRLSPEQRAERRHHQKIARQRRRRERERLDLGALASAARTTRSAWRPKCEPVNVPMTGEPSPETRCSLMDLTSTTCRFPYGDVGDSGFAFCGAHSVSGLPYCDFHMRIAYRPVLGRRLEARR